MRGFSSYSALALLALAASLLVAGCSQNRTPTSLPTPTDTPNYAGVVLLRDLFAPDQPITETVYLGGFLAGEAIDVSFLAEDGAAASLGTTEANRDGHASMEFRLDSLSKGYYSISAVGDQGSRASTVFTVK